MLNSTESLQHIGLTENESKTYIKLLDLGDTTRSGIVSATGIAGSKIYDILERLQKKGLVSIYTENNIKHFKAQSPKQLLNYVNEKEKEIAQEKKDVLTMLPMLMAKYDYSAEEQQIEVLTGLPSIKLFFQEQIDELAKGEYNYVIGGTTDSNEEHIIAMFKQIHSMREQKGIKTKMLYNKRQKKTVEKAYSEKEYPNSQTKFIEHDSAVSINIYKNKVLITIWGKNLKGVKMTSQGIADSFMEFFELLWNQKPAKDT